MKIMIFLSLFVFNVEAVMAACTKKIDNSKVMMFVDTNESALEIATAEKAACARGQKLVVIPNNYKEIDKFSKPMSEASSQFSKCITASLGDSSKCVEISQKLSNLRNDYSKLMSQQPPIQKQIASELDAIKDNKGTIESFTISGHDGGGMYGGNKQGISRAGIQKIFEDYKDINNVKSVMLLGCYTAVPKEIQSWKAIFPDVRLIGGYDGSAPLAFRPEGHDYLYNLLTKEKEMTSVADEKKIQTLIDKNLKSIKLLNASMFLYPTCKNNVDDKSFYYGTSGKNKGVQEYKLGECDKHAAEIANIKDKVGKYYSGELEPPTNTTSGELRSIYSQTRMYEHCLENGGYDSTGYSNVTADLVFGLLFHEGMKNNFANYYSEDLKKADEILKGITQDDFDKAQKKQIEEINTQLANIDKREEFLKLLETDPQKYIEMQESAQKTNEDEYNKLLKSAKFKNFVERHPSFNLDSREMDIYPTNQADLELFMDLSNRKNSITFAKVELKSLKSEPKAVLQQQRSLLMMLRDSHKTSLEKIKATKFSVDVLKDVWIPTKENLKGKTRKEILQNIHNMNGVLFNPTTPENVRGVLGWSNAVATNNLHLLRNPFSWHEFTGGRTEAPSNPIKLEDVLKNPMNASGMGGYGYGPSPYGGVGGGRYPGMGMGFAIQGDLGGPYSDSEDTEADVNEQEEGNTEYNGGY